MAKKVPVIPTAFETPTYDDLVAEYSADLDAELQAAGFSWSSMTRFSFPWVLARVLALADGAIYRFARYIASGILPSTAADLEQLQRFGDEREVYYRYGTLYEGFVTVINASGVDVTLLQGSILTVITTGLKYEITASTTISGSAGFGDAPVVAAAIGDEYSATALAARFDDPPTGISADCIITANAGGVEAEDVEVYRGRILEQISDPPEGGARADWRKWTQDNLEQNVENVWIYSPGDPCPATVDVSGYIPTATVGVCYTLSGTGAAQIPTGDDVSDMTTYLLALDERPVTSIPVAFAPTANNVPISLTVHATSGATTGSEITALEASIRTALATMLDDRLSDRTTPGATAGDVIKNSWIHDAIATVGGLDWHQITALDGGSGDANISTTDSWELTYFTVTFSWV